MGFISLMGQPPAQVVAIRGVEVAQARLERGHVDPQLVSDLVGVRRPGERLPEVPNPDQPARGELIDHGLLALLPPPTPRRRSALDVGDLVGDGGAALSMGLARVQGDPLVPEVGQPDDTDGQVGPREIPVCEGAEVPPWVVHPMNPAARVRQNDQGRAPGLSR